MTELVWFREDLRLHDNPALFEASQSGAPIICIYIYEQGNGPRPLGGAAKWWLHHSLMSLDASLREIGGRLVCLKGDPETLLPQLVNTHKIEQIRWNRRYAPSAVERDKRLKASLSDKGVKVSTYKANVLFEPWEVTNKTGEPYKVFSPFWRAATAMLQPRQPLTAPRQLITVEGVKSDALDEWGLLPQRPNWAAEFPQYWTPGENSANASLDRFCETALGGYGTQRDIPAGHTTSRLSPHLRWGEISPLQIFARLDALNQTSKDISKFKAELGWREFARSLHFYAADLETQNWKPEFNDFPWRESEGAKDDLKAWQRGETGYPIVDAGMRELWATGWMHNRVRMVAASFLVKHLLIDWREGEKWFWDTLVDADPATNPASWQWVAGCGADAAPYFRIFNPYTQTEKFDKSNAYINKWASEKCLAPIIDHAEARARALQAYQDMRAG